MGAPVNVRLEKPEVDGWEEEAKQWKEMNSRHVGNPSFYPLTIKAMYVIGVIYDIYECVTQLLKYPGNYESIYIPAYGVFASGVEILGRCLTGNPNSKGSSKDLKFGFKWLASWALPQDYTSIPKSYPLIKTSSRQYTIEELINLRHFAAHGQGEMQESTEGSKIASIDSEILERMPRLIKNSIETYWSRLQSYKNHQGSKKVSKEPWNKSADELCIKLAKAKVTPFRDWPAFRVLLLIAPKQNDQSLSITEVFERFENEWSVSA